MFKEHDCKWKSQLLSTCVKLPLKNRQNKDLNDEW